MSTVRSVSLAFIALAYAGSNADGQATPPRGTITGVVVDTAGRVFRGASVVLDSGAPRVTFSDGRFSFANVPQGTHQVEVFAIGMKPRLTTVEVGAGQRVELAIRFEPLTTLPTVRVIASHWQQRMMNELADRMAKGHGQFRDSTQVGKRATIDNVFAGLRGVRGVTYRKKSREMEAVMMGISERRSCRAAIYIDGYRETGMFRLNALRPQDISVMEVYDRGNLVPFPFWTGDPSGAIVIWTKDVMP